LRFSDGIEAQLHLDYWAQPQVHHLEIVCSEGSILWDYIGGELRIWDTASETWRTEAFPGIEGRSELFVALARHFLAVIEDGAKPACTLEDGIQAVRIAEAIERSSARNSERVELW
jgi:predicted dehydrogenase